ncbi:hypothetical protein SAMN05444166_5781 [Singulisphaera sp. GP187]|uniref:hypothetical protein n=1 Tax=Singulisphaera sp. GP187 TaxID=1882752 RepID=UPI00092BD6FC|nr:hypothetical protein [Singulisphaera sp. GP187]SIO58706.1 hypothetical protein SAMN05444166_5781 [Singulisphaera sp. GP187]
MTPTTGLTAVLPIAHENRHAPAHHDLQPQLDSRKVPRPRRGLSVRIARLENRLKSAESDIHNEIDLAQLRVKPEDTAGPPAGWGKHELT